MCWLAGRGGPIDRFNQAMLLTVPAALRQDHLTGALQTLLDHHDALRLRLDVVAGSAATENAAAESAASEDAAAPSSPASLSASSPAHWRLTVAPPGAVSAQACVSRVDIGELDDAARRTAIATHAQEAAGRLAPADGLMLQAVWFDAGEQASGRLLLVIHHLAVDGVSWRILLPDLKTAWEAIAQGRAPALPSPGSSFRRWAHELTANAQTPERLAELPLWTGMQDGPVLSLFDGALDPARDLTGTAQELSLTLPATVTGALLTRLPAAFHAGINEVLLTGLALAVMDWCRRHGRGGGAATVLRCWWMSRVTAARRSPPTSICRARWVGSPAFTRCGSIQVHVIQVHVIQVHLISTRSISTMR